MFNGLLLRGAKYIYSLLILRDKNVSKSAQHRTRPDTYNMNANLLLFGTVFQNLNKMCSKFCNPHIKIILTLLKPE